MLAFRILGCIQAFVIAALFPTALSLRKLEGRCCVLMPWKVKFLGSWEKAEAW